MTAPAGARVLLWAHRFAALDTGIGRHVVELAGALAALEQGTPRLRFELCAAAEDRDRERLPAGVAVRELAGNRRLVHLAWTALYRPRIERLAGGPAAVIHALHPGFPVPSRAPLVVTVHDLFKFEHPEWFDRAGRWTFRRAMRWAEAHAAHFIVPSQHTYERLIEHGVGRERVSLILPGISDRFHAPLDTAGRDAVLARYGLVPGGYAIALGAMNERENVGTVIAALARIPPPLGLVLVGPLRGGHLDALAAAERHGVADRVQVTGFVPDADLPALLAGAVALLQPALDEGFGFPPLEAMAVGTPAVIARSGSLPEVVADAALAVAATDPDAWAGAIAALGDEDRRARLVAAGRRRVRRFTWANAAAEHAAIYRRVAEL